MPSRAWPAAGHALISLLAPAGRRSPGFTGAGIGALGLERRHRTMTITDNGGKVVATPLTPGTARAIGLAVSELRRPIFLTP